MLIIGDGLKADGGYCKMENKNLYVLCKCLHNIVDIKVVLDRLSTTRICAVPSTESAEVIETPENSLDVACPLYQSPSPRD